MDAHDIDDVLGLKGLEDQEFVNYKDRILSIETVHQRIGGERREVSEYHSFSSGYEVSHYNHDV